MEGSRLPPGFRFEPTDEEIVFQYLSRKTFSHPLPALLIPEFDVFDFDPWELPGDRGKDRYFFCNKEGGRKIVRATDSGFWKATGSAKRIICSKRMPIVGIQKSFVFFRRNTKRYSRTDWMMHEYYITLSESPKNGNSQGSLVRIGNWTMCRVLSKRRIRVEDSGVCDAYSSSSSSSLSDSGFFEEVSSG